mgnify:CR=1 FL=1
MTYRIPRYSKKRLKAIEDGELSPWPTSSKPKAPTGEIALLDRLMEERGPFSEISGVPLPPKGTPQYHFCLSHILSKGEYPELRLEDFNVILITPAEHRLWHEAKWTLKDKPEWRWVLEKEAALKLEIRTR